MDLFEEKLAIDPTKFSGGNDRLSFTACNLYQPGDARTQYEFTAETPLDSTSMFAIYDGHGVNTAPIVCNWELKKILKSPEFIDGDWASTIQSGFERLENKFVQESMFDEEPEDPHAIGYGSTALTLFLDDTKLLVANAGDSRCIMSCGGQVGNLSADHKVTNISVSEAEWITTAGGNIDSNMINGNSKLTRILGSLHLKQGRNQGVIISQPELKQISLPQDINFIVLASESLWTNVSSETIVSTIRDNLEEGTSSACDALCKYILDEENKSVLFDVMVIIVEFKKPLPIYPAKKRTKSTSSSSEEVSIIPRYISPLTEYEIKRGNLEEKYVFCRFRNKQDTHVRITAATITSDPADPKFKLIPERPGEFVKDVGQLCMPLGKSHVSKAIEDGKKGKRLQAVVGSYRELAESDSVMC